MRLSALFILFSSSEVVSEVISAIYFISSSEVVSEVICAIYFILLL